MPAMTKRVNIRTTVAVRTVNPPISGTKTNIIMSTSDILKCLCRRAVVEEILPNGKTIRLNMNNYYLDNGAGLDAYNTTPTKVEVKSEPKPEIKNVNANVVSSADIENVIDPEPVAEETTTESHEETVEIINETTTETVEEIKNDTVENVVENTEETVTTETEDHPHNENNNYNHKKNKKR